MTKLIKIISALFLPTGIDFTYRVGDVTHFIFHNVYESAELLRQYGVITSYRNYHGTVFLTVAYEKTLAGYSEETGVEYATRELSWNNFIREYDLTNDRALHIISQVEEEKQKHCERIEMRVPVRVTSGRYTTVIHPVMAITSHI